MFNLREYRRHQNRLSDFLPWAALIGPGIVLNKDGSFQRSARFRGPDLDSAIPAELGAVAARLNSAFRRLGSGWAIFVEAQRRPSISYPDSRFPDRASALVELERKAQFEEAGAHFESLYVLTLVWLPPPEQLQATKGWFFDGAQPQQLDSSRRVEQFADQTQRMLQMLESFMPEAAWLTDAETLSFLHSTISTGSQNIAPPEVPAYLDCLLADQPLSGGLEPRLGDCVLRTLTINGFPTATLPGILDDLNRLAFPYRWTTRAILLDKVDAGRILTRIRRQWFAKRKSILSVLKEVMTNEASPLSDSDAANKAFDADLALQELGADEVGHAYVTVTITVWDADSTAAAEKLRQVEKLLQGRDFICVPERMNAVEAWLGSLPGQVYANVRQPPLSTLNLVHMMPSSAVWAGDEGDRHLQGPPLFLAKADGSTPFRFSLHVGDVGHTLIAGPTGAGKSVLLALMALQFRRYPNARIFAFDFGGSLRVAALAMDGRWHNLGADDDAQVALQPLAGIDDEGQRAWAAAWAAALLARQGVEITPATRELLWSALTSLASAPRGERSLTGLSVLLQSQALKQALAPFCVGGPFGRLLDAEEERLSSAAVEVYETEGLVGTQAAPAVLSYLFRRIEAQLDGGPTLIIIDEGWLALDDDNFAGQLREWLKTLRKKNTSVIFATQSLADIGASKIAASIIESCPTRIFLPNERAQEAQIRVLYEGFGLNARQIEIIARAYPKRDYYCQSRRGDRLFALDLGEIALALTAASSKTDQVAIQTLINQRPDGFLDRWLIHCGLQWATRLNVQVAADA